MTKCYDCGDEIKDGVELKCCECHNYYHYFCAGVTEEDFEVIYNNENNEFKCHPCIFRRWERNRYSQAASFARGGDAMSADGLMTVVNNNFDAMLSMVEDLHLELNNKFMMLTENLASIQRSVTMLEDFRKEIYNQQGKTVLDEPNDANEIAVEGNADGIIEDKVDCNQGHEVNNHEVKNVQTQSNELEDKPNEDYKPVVDVNKKAINDNNQSNEIDDKDENKNANDMFKKSNEDKPDILNVNDKN